MQAAAKIEAEHLRRRKMIYFLHLQALIKKPFFVLLLFFASPKKNQKRSPTKDYIAFVGWFPDLAFVLLWLRHW